ncbi:MAG: ATP-binding region, ATPase-like:Histidine kinase N-terminal [Rhodocyclaceae bacterium]|nr:ATP-binding region, ATPase-like:Histidine kinase N-terminal [Rhodocyclaceae bacterium]
MSFISGNADGTHHLANLQRLASVRWMVLGVMSLLAIAGPGLLAIPLPRIPLLAVVAVAAGFNFLLRLRLARADAATPLEVLSQIGFDIASLTALLFFSGGATNPLVSLLLPPVAIAALTLPVRHVFATGALALAAYSVLMVFYLPLPLSDPARATRLHLIGMWLTFAISAAMIGWFVVRMTALIRQRDAELAAAREQAMRDERVVALGTLAAGAAHELGTPLATMAVIASELEYDKTLSAAARDDLAVLRQQIGICKEIITGLSRQAGAERLEQALAVRADVWLDGLRQRWHSLRPQASSQFRLQDDAPPTIIADPTLEQAVLNLLNNAANTGNGEIELAATWNDVLFTIQVRDHGPGFAAHILDQAGKTAFPAHPGGSGIGLMLTQSAVERLNGRLTLSNHPAGGAVARIELPLKQPGQP